jgi:hypothetical protein
LNSWFAGRFSNYMSYFLSACPLAARARALRLNNVRFVPYVPGERLRYVFGAADMQLLSLRRGLG